MSLHETHAVVDQPVPPRTPGSNVPETLDRNYSGAAAVEVGTPHGQELQDEPAQEHAETPENADEEQPVGEPVQQDKEAGPEPAPDSPAAHTDGVIPEHTEAPTPIADTEPREQAARAAGELVVDAEDSTETDDQHEPAQSSVPEQEEVEDSRPDETIPTDSEPEDQPAREPAAEAASETPEQARITAEDRTPPPTRPDNAGSGNDKNPPETVQGNEGDGEIRSLSVNEYLEEASRYISLGENDSIRLLDPRTGAPIVGDAIPKSLQEHPTLSAGYEFLARNGYRVDMNLLLTRHELNSDLSDAGIDLHAEAERLAGRGGTLYVESISQDRPDNSDMQAGLSRVTHLRGMAFVNYVNRMAQDQQKGENSYNFGVALHLAGTGVEIATPDYALKSSDPVDQALVGLGKLHNTQITDINTDDDAIRSYYAVHAVEGAYIRYRDQYLVGKIGHHMATHDREPSSDIYGSFLTGAGHRNIGYYLNNLGVARVAYTGLNANNYSRLPLMSNTLEASRRGVFTQENLDRINQYMLNLG